MSVIYKTSNAYINPSADRIPFWILESLNPEEMFVPMLSEFFLEVGFKNLYPNFGNVRIGTIHPFAMLLLQDVLGQKLDFNVFPSVTISDSSDSEAFPTLARGFHEFQVTERMYVEMMGHAAQGRLIISDANKTRMKTLMDSQDLIARKTSVRLQHKVDFNIWSDNKAVTSLMYDMTQHFFNGKRSDIHLKGIDVIGELQGRRSGDINVEFGRLLYGANITVTLAIESGAMYIDPQYDSIQTINVDANYQNP